jgi:hypothetical protein
MRSLKKKKRKKKKGRRGHVSKGEVQRGAASNALDEAAGLGGLSEHK